VVQAGGALLVGTGHATLARLFQPKVGAGN